MSGHAFLGRVLQDENVALVVYFAFPNQYLENNSKWLFMGQAPISGYVLPSGKRTSLPRLVMPEKNEDSVLGGTYAEG